MARSLISLMAFAAAISGTAKRTSSQPAVAKRLISSIDCSTFTGFVVIIDWMLTGA